jgi:hypothetical protein
MPARALLQGCTADMSTAGASGQSSHRQPLQSGGFCARIPGTDRSPARQYGLLACKIGRTKGVQYARPKEQVSSGTSRNGIKALIVAVGLDPSKYATHSARRGAAVASAGGSGQVRNAVTA